VIKQNQLSTKKILLMIFVSALILRLAFGLIFYHFNKTNDFGDDWDYIQYAELMLKQGIFVPDTSQLSASSGPAFPLVVATMFFIFGKNYLPVIILNAIISALLCVVIYALGKELFNRKVGLWASAWSVFYILFIRYIPRVLKENWLSFLFPLIIFLFIKETKREKKYIYFILFYSILYTFLIHMDERFFFYFPILVLGFVFLDQKSWKLGLKKGALFFSLACIFMAPWFFRNLNVYERPVILTERTARFTDKIFGYQNEADKLKKIYNEKIERYKKATELLLNGKEVTFKVRRLETLKKAIKLGYIPHKYTTFERWKAEFKEFWRPFRFKGGFVGDGFRFEGPSWSLKHNISTGITYGLLLPLFIIGIYFVLKNRNKYSIFILFIILIHTCIHIVMAHVRNRYRIPIDAFIILIAFFGLQQLYLIFQNWQKNRSC